VQNDAGSLGGHRESIALFINIASTVIRCSVQWYKPAQGTWGDGAVSISTLDMGGKPFAEAVGSQEISYQNTKSFIDAKTVQGSLDLGNWGRTIGHAFQNDGNSFDCKGPELAVHFALNNAQVEGSVIMDQVSQLNINVYVQRAG
jgi:hypothetical protein